MARTAVKKPEATHNLFQKIVDQEFLVQAEKKRRKNKDGTLHEYNKNEYVQDDLSDFEEKPHPALTNPTHLVGADSNFGLQLPQSESNFLSPRRAEDLAQGEMSDYEAVKLLNSPDYTEEEQAQVDAILNRVKTAETAAVSTEDATPKIAAPPERAYDVDLMVEEGIVDYDAGRKKIEIHNIMANSRGGENKDLSKAEVQGIRDAAFYNEPQVKQFIQERREKSGEKDYDYTKDPVVQSFYQSTNEDRENTHGHAFVRIRSSDEDGQIDQYSFGFGNETWSDKKKEGRRLSNLTNPDAAAKGATLADTKQVNYSSASRFMDFIRSYPDSVFGLYSENCTKFAVEALGTAGMRVNGVGKLRFLGFGAGGGIKKLYSPTQISKAYGLYKRQANLIADITEPDREPLVGRLRARMSTTGLYKYICINLQRSIPSQKGSTISALVRSELNQLLENSDLAAADLSSLFLSEKDGSLVARRDYRLDQNALTKQRQKIMTDIAGKLSTPASVKRDNMRREAQQELDAIKLVPNNDEALSPDDMLVPRFEALSQHSEGDCNIVKYLFGFNPALSHLQGKFLQGFQFNVLKLNNSLRVFDDFDLRSRYFFRRSYMNGVIEVLAACARALLSDANGVIHWPKNGANFFECLENIFYDMDPEVLSHLRDALSYIAPEAEY